MRGISCKRALEIEAKERDAVRRVSKMAEMTAEQVKTLLESFAALCGSNSKAKELCGDAIKFVEQQAATIEALEKTIVKRCQYHRKNDAHRCPYNSKGCMDWELCNKHFHDCGKEWQVKEGQG